VKDPSEPEPTPKKPMGRDAVLVLAVLVEGGLAPLALGVGWLLGRHPLTGFAWTARDAAIGVAATLPLLAFFLAALRWPVGPLARIQRFWEAEIEPVLEPCTWSDLALIALAAGVGEEMFFRGVIQAIAAQRLGPWAGLAAASAVFGLLHPITSAYIVIAALMGAYLGAVWIANGNLLTVIVSHALYDFLALLAMQWTRARRERAVPG
jgi:membrane protease YdiL (CAAX protease family)